METDGEGKIKFYVPLERGLIPADARKLSILATAVNYTANPDTKMKQPFKYSQVSSNKGRVVSYLYNSGSWMLLCEIRILR